LKHIFYRGLEGGIAFKGLHFLIDQPVVEAVKDFFFQISFRILKSITKPVLNSPGL